MISVLSFVIAMPFVTTASALLTFTTGYSSPPDYPVTSNVQISPAHPVVGDEISCSYDFYDQSGDIDKEEAIKFLKKRITLARLLIECCLNSGTSFLDIVSLGCLKGVLLVSGKKLIESPARAP